MEVLAFYFFHFPPYHQLSWGHPVSQQVQAGGASAPADGGGMQLRTEGRPFLQDLLGQRGHPPRLPRDGYGTDTTNPCLA